jgi:hypothetical protein
MAGQADGVLFLHTAELRESSFLVVTALTKVVAVVAAGLAVVAVVTQVITTPHFKAAGVVVAVQVMLHSSRMVRLPLGVALHRVGRSTHLRVLAECLQDRRWEVAVEATKTSPTT